jgi:phytoene dehydrogenase-like protein
VSAPLDAVVVGAGPNGLAAGIELARSGLSVLILEANETIGGSARTEELTLPGFHHDVGSAVYPLGIGSPFFSSLPLAEHGLEWVHPEVPLAHPLDGEETVFLHRSLDETARGLGKDQRAYRRLVEPFVRAWPSFADHVLNSPLRPPKDPVLMGRFGMRAVRSTSGATSSFRTSGARALFAGNAAHSGLPLEQRPAAAIGLTLMAAGHAVGWPIPRGGAGALTGALASLFRSLGGTIETGTRIESIDDLPAARARLLALTHRQVAAVAGSRLPDDYADSLKNWQYGPGAFKVDWALDGPMPWTAKGVDRACTVHLGGTLEEIGESERAPAEGRLADHPYVLFAQPSLFDPTRAPEGKHTAWAYCHVPNGWNGDATDAIENQVDRFAPGFRDRVLARAVHGPAQLEAWNANLVGGDVSGGSPSLAQTLGPARWSSSPWGTPLDDLYICSASAPPGGGVHGMAGYHAARAALKKTFGR